MFNLADHEISRSIRDILLHGYKDVNPRPKYKDGTPGILLTYEREVEYPSTGGT